MTNFIYSINFFNYLYNDVVVSKQYGFQDPASPIMEGVINLHNHITFIAIVVVSVVSWYLFSIFHNDHYSRFRITKFFFYPENPVLDYKLFKDERIFLSKLLIVRDFTRSIRHVPVLEFLWTIFPGLILITIAVPSFILLYSIDEFIEPCIVFKVDGHQWYWSYSWPSAYSSFDVGNSLFDKVQFDSYMLADDELSVGQFRLLETDNIIYFPTYLNIKILITASDVLHSWAVPSLGIKMDAVPGRVNQVFTFIKREGMFYGQCSELCGVNHGFMPIAIESISYKNFLMWLNFQVLEKHIEYMLGLFDNNNLLFSSILGNQDGDSFDSSNPDNNMEQFSMVEFSTFVVGSDVECSFVEPYPAKNPKDFNDYKEYTERLKRLMFYPVDESVKVWVERVHAFEGEYSQDKYDEYIEYMWYAFFCLAPKETCFVPTEFIYSYIRFEDGLHFKEFMRAVMHKYSVIFSPNSHFCTSHNILNKIEYFVWLELELDSLLFEYNKLSNSEIDSKWKNFDYFFSFVMADGKR